MLVSKVRVYDLEESIEASKYPLSTDIESVDDEITPTVNRLAQSEKGAGHDQFLTGIVVNFNLTFTVKGWVEAERYRFLNFISSQSTMHCISKFNIKDCCHERVDPRIIEIVEEKKRAYLNDKNEENFLNLIYNVPVGFKLTARLTTNYRCLKTIYSQRKFHRLPEWKEFCKWIETLPHSEFITGKVNK